MRPPVFFCCLLLSFSAVAGLSVEKKSIILSEGVAVRAPTVKLQLPKNAEIIRGKQKWRRILKLDVAPDNAANDHVARIAVDVPINSAVWGEILYRGEKIIPLKEKKGGIVWELHFPDDSGGKVLYEPSSVDGTFSWRYGMFMRETSSRTRRGVLLLGLRNASGSVEFDLSSLIAAAFDPLKSDRTELRPEEVREIGLLETRLKEDLLKRKIADEKDIRSSLAVLQEDGSFAGIDYGSMNRSAWAPARHLKNAYEWALAWARPGQKFYRSGELAVAIRSAVRYWVKHRPQSDNWWFNDIFVPEKMSQILLLACPVFSAEEFSAALEVCRQAAFLPRFVGHNLLYVAKNIFNRAVLERNPVALQAAIRTLSAGLCFAEPAPQDNTADFGGLRADGCYQQHGFQVQFGNYGVAFFQDAAYWANMWKGTRYALNEEQWDLLRYVAFDGFRWVLWKGNMDLLAIGRQLGRNAAVIKGKMALRTFEALGHSDPRGAERYRIVVEENVSGKNQLTGNRYFWNSGYMTHRRGLWCASVRMNSCRVTPVEDGINWDNALGRYFSEGVCLIYRTGREYENITPCWDWTRLPGTTLPASPIRTSEESEKIGLRCGTRPPRWTFSRSWRLKGESIFTGGVSDGIHGIAAHVQNIDGVRAKKAYFFDTDAIYELGAAIESESPYPVATTVNTVLRRGAVRQGDGWVHHDDIGYRGRGWRIVTGKRAGDWRYLEGGLLEAMPVRCDLFSLVVEHGTKISGGTYEFVILPGMTAGETAAWNRSYLLTNNENLQAVKLADGTIAAVFHIPGRLKFFETDSPGVFLIRQNQVWAADPTAELRQMTLSLHGRRQIVKLPAGEWAGNGVQVLWTAQ